MSNNPAIDTILSYAPPRPRRTKWILYCAMILAMVALTPTATRVAPLAWQQCRMIYLQHRLMSDQSAPLTPVYSAQWTASAHGSVITHTGQDNQTWHQLRTFGMGPADKALAGVYSHEITTKDGRKLLVVVRVTSSVGDNQDLDPATSLVLEARLVEPGTLWRYPAESSSPSGCAWFFDTSLERMAGQGLVIYAGQPDPADPSTFTIDYDLNGIRHTLFAHYGPYSMLIDQRK